MSWPGTPEQLTAIAAELRRERDQAQESLVELQGALTIALRSKRQLIDRLAAQALYIAALEAQLEPAVIEEIKIELSALGASDERTE